MIINIVKPLLILATSLIVIGCSSSRFTLETQFDSSPVKTSTVMSEALKCLGGQLEQDKENSSAYVFMVRDIIDGTIKHNNYSDGPLSDSGRIQLISTLTAHTKQSYGIVIDQFPLMFKPVINEQVGLDRYGLPSKENFSNFLPTLTSVANQNRSTNGMQPIDSVMPIIIDGAFTRFDSSHTHSKGYGQNGGYRGDLEDEQSAAVDFGDSGSERSITLVVNIIDPQTNVVIGTEGFDLKFYSNSKKARFRIAIGEYYYGFSNTDVTVETLHAAQQTLLDAASVWILDNAYGNKADFSPCFQTEENLALGKDSRHEQAIILANALTPVEPNINDTVLSESSIITSETIQDVVVSETAKGSAHSETVDQFVEQFLDQDSSIENVTTTESATVSRTEVNALDFQSVDDWLFSLPNGSYTLQLASFITSDRDVDYKEIFEEKFDRNVWLFQSSKLGSPWAYLLHGKYNSVTDAENDIIQLDHKTALVRSVNLIRQSRCDSWKLSENLIKLTEYCENLMASN